MTRRPPRHLPLSAPPGLLLWLALALPAGAQQATPAVDTAAPPQASSAATEPAPLPQAATDAPVEAPAPAPTPVETAVAVPSAQASGAMADPAGSPAPTQATPASAAAMQVPAAPSAEAVTAPAMRARVPLPPPAVRTPADVLPWRGVVFRITAPAPAAPLAPAAGTPATAPAAEVAPPPASDAATATAGQPPAPAAAVSYLLGTIHFGSDQEHGITPDQLQRLVDASSVLVNEVDIDATADAALDDYRWLGPEQSLAALIGQEGMQQARTLLPQVDPLTLDRMKPWLVLSLLEARGERTDENTMDVRLQRMAASDGLQLVHLETMATQLQALDCVPSQEQAQVLAERLRTPWLMQEESARALAFYHDGNLWAWLADVDRMYGLGEPAKAIEMRARQCLLEQRNAQWIPQLLALLGQGGALVAVGAIHLPGNEGLLAALQRAGYRVEAQPL